ncbi:MAG: nucleotidyltransferase domain-containing protein, partial [Candidatus Omnitrophica bacterium]|nr:nucleotidyltransferase domain-containing protein [Candidatus Omnitrophota bacterium]
MKVNLQKEIEKITEQIIKEYKPERIILFGSAVSGRLMPGSDIDLLVVKETKRNPWARTK